MTDYKVDIKTVDESYAGTDSQVAIKLWSEDVVSKVATLDNWGNDFEPGAVDSYTVQADLGGPVTAVELFLDGNDQWRPEWVKVTDPTSKLIWRAFFGTAMGRGSAKSPAVLIDVDGKYRSPDTGDDAAQRSLLATYVEGLKEMVEKNGGAPNLIATGLIQFLERAGFKPIRFLSIGSGVGGTVIGTTALEGGAVHSVNGGALGRKVGDYFTITSGWEVGVGVSPSVTVAAWTSQTVDDLRKWTFCKTATAQVLAGMGVSLIWSAPGSGSERPTSPAAEFRSP
jgi:hypothetical protein